MEFPSYSYNRPFNINQSKIFGTEQLRAACEWSKGAANNSMRNECGLQLCREWSEERTKRTIQGLRFNRQSKAKAYKTARSSCDTQVSKNDSSGGFLVTLRGNVMRYE